jgi:hypothetical protein
MSIPLEGQTAIFIEPVTDEGDLRGQPLGLLLCITHPVALSDIDTIALTGQVGTFEEVE